MDSLNSTVQEKLDEVMPWIGLYIAVASAVCTLAMAADAFNGFKSKKFWFPCNYFSLNAASLTLLAVAMKLPMDLNTYLLYQADWHAKICSLIFMSISMSNFMSSLGSMTDKEILMNTVALGILVITIVVNMCIQTFQLHGYFHKDMMIMALNYTILMLLSLAGFLSSAISLPTSKRSLESKYQEMHQVAMREDGIVKKMQGVKIDKRMIDGMKKYWVMAETSNPQFVMARSIFCTASNVICLFAASSLQTVYIRWIVRSHKVTLGESASVYGRYTKWILTAQSSGVLVGTIAPISRWFIAIRFKCLTTYHEISFGKELRIEDHWIQTLKYWRDSFSGIQIQDGKCRKYIHNVKWFTLTFLIGVQIMMVLFNKLLLFIPTLLITPFLLCFKKFKTRGLAKATTSNKDMRSESGGNIELNLNRFVLLLDGEPELPQSILKDICDQADKVIETGTKQQPKNLLQLLNRFGNFSGVREFDSLQVPSLHSQEPPNCWTLPLVTLTSIAISLPNIAINHKATQLVSSVSEGLSLVMLIEKTLDQNGELMNIRNAADVTWAGVAIYRKWQQIDLRQIALDCKSSKNLLQELSSRAEMTVLEFKRKVNDFLMKNPLNWPASVIAANSMYRICQTILLSCQEENDRIDCQEQADEGLFERLSVMIADILAACFTNLSHVMITKCHRNAIEEREKSVHEAFLLLGKTRQIVELVQRQEWPSLGHDKAAFIEEWRALFLQDNENPVTSTSSNKAGGSLVSNGEQITVTVDDNS
ncbi:uncharacterized protein LOC105157443 [Sesamum indicum]|uniref:Uncharacterized protein LOC105157443 n=1 Tax=Sesamum indicum TaxID=4182 RepID=A0A6I9SQT0_SESIN|nr:uncharacterized protein LOC105157443 [Sesamum indicum]